MQFSDESKQKWEQIIQDITVTSMPPLECIKKLTLKLQGKRQRTINLASLKKQGHSIQEIEALLNSTLKQLDHCITDVEFTVDTAAVAAMVQPETDKLLEKLR